MVNLEELPGLVERLREFCVSDSLGDSDFSVCDEAADTLESLAAEVVWLREALKVVQSCEYCEPFVTEALGGSEG